MNWWRENPSLGWLIVAVALGAVEVVTLDLVFLMLAGGALVAAASALLGVSFFWQVFVAIVASVAMIGFVRPAALRHLHRSDPESRTGVDGLIGRTAVVIEPVNAQAGRVKLAGDIWSARTYDPDLILEAGSTVDVLAIDGATAVVHATHL